MDQLNLPQDPAAIAAAFGYHPDEIAICPESRLPPDDYLLLYQGDKWCAFVDDFARQERGLSNCFIVIFKPDVISRGLQGKLLAEWIDEGFVMEDMQFYQAATAKFWERHYQEHKNKDWFSALIEAMANRPIMVFGMYRPGITRADAIVLAREFMKKQREKYGVNFRNNSVHVSDSEEAAYDEGVLWLYGLCAALAEPTDDN